MPAALSKLKDGDTFYLYLSITEVIVSGVLICEEDKIQKSFYYTSIVLHAAGERYPSIEKFALALVKSGRKLKPYDI